MAGEKEQVDAYLDTINRFEPDIAMTDNNAALTSIAISMKRIADALNEPNDHGEVGTAAMAGAIVRGLRGQS